jgi:hypothetical protein
MKINSMAILRTVTLATDDLKSGNAEKWKIGFIPGLR